MPQPDTVAVKRPSRFVRIVLFIAAAVALLSIYLFARHLWLSVKVNAELSRIRAAKEPVTLKELDAYYKRLPLSEEGAKIYEQAFNSIRLGGSRRFLENVTEFPHDTNALPQDLRDKFEKSVTDSTNALEELRKAAASGACRFRINYTEGWYAIFVHLPMLRACGRLEACNGVLKEQSGDVNAAIQSVELITKYAKSLNGQPDLVGVLFQERLNIQAYDLSAWILNHRQLSADQLATMQMAFEKTEPTDWIERIIMSDRCSDLATFDYSPAAFLSLISTNAIRVSDALAVRFVHLTSQAKEDELALLRRLEEVRETAQLPFPDRLPRADKLSAEIKTEAKAHSFFVTGSLVPPLIRIIDRDAEHAAYMRLIRTALAIERYRIDHGALPGSLDTLRQGYVKDIALDPFDGQRLRYLPSNQGYLLYSIGPDRVDDQGEKSVNPYSNEPKPEGDLTLWVHR